jgi:hypothetical protein
LGHSKMVFDATVTAPHQLNTNEHATLANLTVLADIVMSNYFY